MVPSCPVNSKIPSNSDTSLNAFKIHTQTIVLKEKHVILFVSLVAFEPATLENCH